MEYTVELRIETGDDGEKAMDIAGSLKLRLKGDKLGTILTVPTKHVKVLRHFGDGYNPEVVKTWTFQ